MAKILLRGQAARPETISTPTTHAQVLQAAQGLDEKDAAGPFRSFEYGRLLSRTSLLVHLGSATTTFYNILLHANEHGRANPSMSTIAHETGQCVRTVKNHVRKLNQLGAISVTKRPVDSGGWSNQYAISPLDQLIAKLSRRKDLPHADPSNVVQLRVSEGAKLGQRGGKKLHPNRGEETGR